MEEIEAIAEEVRAREKNAWFFWSKNSAEKDGLHKRGYYIPIRWLPNSKHIMFVAPNPSTGKYTDKENKDKLRIFLDTLHDYDFAKRIFSIADDCVVYYEGCFVTDLIKIRLSKEKAEKPLLEFKGSKWEDYFNREINAINPLLIVALGNDAYKVLRRMMLDRPIEKIYHYGILRFGKNREKFTHQIKRIKRVYNFLINRTLKIL